jgi:FtsP/CotA-like multicopper oxidase with cupredoxin domain
MRPDLFEQHTVHWHGYPNASSYFDGVPDASVSINIAGSFTYYYRVNDAGTYFWHCHITPPEHLQMGMVGQLFVRPRQNRVNAGTSLSSALVTNNAKAPKVPGWTSASNPSASNGCSDILCTGQTPIPATTAVVNAVAGGKYAYNDGDASTRYDVEYPIQIMGFDPNFHFVGMTFNPEPFVDMKDKYYVLNGRGYPDTVGGDAGTAGVLSAEGSDAVRRASQPLPSVITIPAGKKALLRLSNLSVTEYSTLGTIGIPMHVIGMHARLLRDTAGGDMSYYTNSVTMGGGESMDVMLDATDTTAYPAGSVFFLYSKNLDHLSNDAENFGGQMTEIRIN